VTEIEQKELVDSAALQVLVVANSAAFDPPITTPDTSKDPPPEFFTVTSFGALPVPFGVLEKLREDGDTDSFGALCAIAGGTKPTDSKTDNKIKTRNNRPWRAGFWIDRIGNATMSHVARASTYYGESREGNEMLLAGIGNAGYF
jgi:hypothetical protein